jgi:serine beta-lactamase-like protein LACTB
MRLVPLAVILLVTSIAASPPYQLVDLLARAETIGIVVSDARDDDVLPMPKAARYLAVSQGDAHLGRPTPRIAAPSCRPVQTGCVHRRVEGRRAGRIALLFVGCVLHAACAPTSSAPARAPAPAARTVVDRTAGTIRDPAWQAAIHDVLPAIEKAVASGTPGVSIAVAVQGKLVWVEGFGWADVEARRAVTPTTQFRVGSVAKPMTSVAMAELVEARRLDLDAPVQTYVPSFPAKPWPITTRELAGHLAGIRHYVHSSENFRSEHYPTALGGLVVFADDPLVAEPRTRFSYSSYGWNLIGAIVESIAGVPFPTLMQQRVFARLGMSHTVPDDVLVTLPDRASCYSRASDGTVAIAPAADNSYKWASGGMLSTPTDLIQLGFEMLHPHLLRPETWELLLTPQTTLDGATTHYGLGWVVGTRPGHRRWAGHSGSSIGGTTELRVLRDEDVVVAVVSNLSDDKSIMDILVAIGAAFAPASP